MKLLIVFICSLMFSVSALAKNEERAAIIFNEDGYGSCGFYFGNNLMVGDTLAVRGQYAGGGAGLPSNGSLRCQGEHELELEKSVPFHDGFCQIDGYTTENVHGVVSKGGSFLFYCNFPKAPKDYEPI